MSHKCEVLQRWSFLAFHHPLDANQTPLMGGGDKDVTVTLAPNLSKAPKKSSDGRRFNFHHQLLRKCLFYTASLLDSVTRTRMVSRGHPAVCSGKKDENPQAKMHDVSLLTAFFGPPRLPLAAGLLFQVPLLLDL